MAKPHVNDLIDFLSNPMMQGLVELFSFSRSMEEVTVAEELVLWFVNYVSMKLL